MNPTCFSGERQIRAAKTRYCYNMGRLIACTFAALTIACGSSAAPKEETTPVAPEPAQTQEESPQEKFDRQRLDAVAKMCTRLIDCSFEDAMQNKSPEEVAELEKVRGKAEADCSEQYGGVSMSPRQVIGIRGCLGQPTACGEFSECLTGAMKAQE